MLFPNIVELNTSSIPYISGASDQVFGRVNFNGLHAFDCFKINSPYQADMSPQHVYAWEKIVALFGACWDFEKGGEDFNVLRVCPGDKIYQYRMNSDNTRSSLRAIAFSDSQVPPTVVDRGIDEFFTGSSESIHVHYVCDHSVVHVSLEESMGSAYAKIIRIFSHVFCSQLSNLERESVLNSLPPLNVFTDHNFWEYQITYPDQIFQIHKDFDPLLNEHYSLGAKISTELRIVPVTSLDPDDLHMTNKLKYSLVGGTVCDQHGGVSRQTNVVFQCPNSWQELATTVPADQKWTAFKMEGIPEKKFLARIASVTETHTCEYEYLIETNALCIDSQFIPRVIAIENQKIQCHSAGPN